MPKNIKANEYQSSCIFQKEGFVFEYLIHAKTNVFNYKKIQTIEGGTNELNLYREFDDFTGKS